MLPIPPINATNTQPIQAPPNSNKKVRFKKDVKVIFPTEKDGIFFDEIPQIWYSESEEREFRAQYKRDCDEFTAKTRERKNHIHHLETEKKQTGKGKKGRRKSNSLSERINWYTHNLQIFTESKTGLRDWDGK